MREIYCIILFSTLCLDLAGQAKEAINPTISPSLFRYNDQITVTYDATGTPLANLTNAFIWVWIPGETIDAKYNITPANTNVPQAKFTKSIVEGKTLFTITFKPSDFFNADISAQTEIGMLLKGNDWANGQTTDFITTFWDGSFQIKLNSPATEPLFIEEGEVLHIDAEVPVASTFKLFVNDILVNEAPEGIVYTYDYTVTQSTGGGIVRLEATSGGTTVDTEFQYLVSQGSPTVVRPSGIIPGINYGSDNTKVTLCLWAPDKNSVYVRGDFSDWLVLGENLMNRDGEYFWLEIGGLTSATEYGFQYLVDEAIFLADPYADKILDPDDQYIPSSVYPDLKPFPDEARNENWYFNRVSVLQTNQTPYNWQTDDYERPEKESLVVYELLIRDFFDAENRSYQNLIDTISYFKRLGVNAIELMPIMEFNGNESWGYNPAFMFAPDKYYGPKNKLKEFIDKCHAEGIAVILDIAMNHQDIPNPYVLMDFDFSTNKPKATNKWFNVTATHPFSVFFDMNHESSYTKAYLDTVNYYWLNEYKVDGFRFDLSKGFTQKNNPNDVGAWSAYDETRIALLQRMADEIWEHTPDAIVILEHLSVNSEEKELAEYRADEGKGMMLWGNMNHSFNQLTMGYVQDSDISGVSFQQRNWSSPHLVSYMESHDEERLNYRNKTFGNLTAKNPLVSLERIKAASVLFYAVPGPKMLWQFGELGYDYSINTCTDGSINNDCRVSPKPVTWQYQSEGARHGLFFHTADLIKLHTSYPVFSNGSVTVTAGSSLLKQVQVKNNPYTDSPASTDQMNVVAVANFEFNATDLAINFPHTGTWFDYYEGEAISVTAIPYHITISAGTYKLYTDVSIGKGPVTDAETELTTKVMAYPNPTTGKFKFNIEATKVSKIIDSRGAECEWKTDGQSIDISHLSSGMYMLFHQDSQGRRRSIKIYKIH
jgi:1,4-alpha-glucan branching enzyme